jgi:uncharacterized protein YdeI (YjbR/CyaY-like superfamily)
MGSDDRPVPVTFPSALAWERWLEEHHADAQEAWLKIAKAGVEIESVRYPEVLESALCFGWIDARRRAHDEIYFLQRFTPRRARSRWSQINREKAERLIAEGRLRPAGMAEVRRAQADGRWQQAYAGQKRSTVPADLQRELELRPQAAEFFAALSSQNRYAITYRLGEAKRPETRARRLAKFLAMLEAGETIHP